MSLTLLICAVAGLTIKISRADKGDVDAKVAMIRGAVETEVDGKRYGRPGWIFAAAVEANLRRSRSANISVSS